MEILEMLRDLSKGRPITAALYARYSSNAQNDGNSIEAQVKAIEDFAGREKIVITGRYVDEACSGTNADRPRFQDMINDAKNMLFNIVLVHKYDRFMRDERTGLIYEDELKRYGVFLISVAEPINSDEPINDVTKSILRSYAAYYSKNLSREVMKGMKINAQNGYTNGGTPPLGYDLESVTTGDGKSRKQYVVNEEEAKIVKLIFQMIIDGSGYIEIINRLNAMNYNTKSGHPFKKNSIHDILRNRKYQGDLIFNKCTGKDPFSHTRNSHKYKRPEDWIIIPDGIPAIISKEDFKKVQDIMDKRKQIRHPEYIVPYLLSGKIICGVCNYAYTGNYNRSPKYKEPYKTYRCGNRASRGSSCECKNKPIRLNEIEPFVLTTLSKSIFNPRIVDTIMDRFKKYVQKRCKSNSADIKRLQSSLTDYKRQESNLLKAISETDSDIVRKSILSQLESVGIQKEQAERELSDMKANTTAIPDKNVLKNLINTAKRQFLSGSLKETKEIINVFVDKIIVGIDNVDLKINLIPSFVCKPGFQDTITISRKELKRYKNKVS